MKSILDCEEVCDAAEIIGAMKQLCFPQDIAKADLRSTKLC